MAGNVETRKIMTKPLPEILDELDESIGLANEAAKVARQAAGEARLAGEKAAKEAAIEVRKTAMQQLATSEAAIEKKFEETNARLAEVERLSELLKTAIMEGIASVEGRISGKATDASNDSSKKRKTN